MKKKIMLCGGCRAVYEEAGMKYRKSGSAMETMTVCAQCRKRRLCALCEVGK